MALTIDQLNIELTANSQKASSAIDNLAQNLERLKTSLGPLANVNIKVSNSFNTLTKSVKSASSGTTNAKNAFNKLDETIKKQEKHLSLLKNEYASYVLKNQESSDSAKMLANRINNLSTDLSKNKQRLEQAKKAADKLDVSNKKLADGTKNTSKSFSSFAQSLAQKISTTRTLVSVFQNAANTMADWFNESNEHIETVNLFRVTMGGASKEAQAFAENVSALMGIDPAEWMQYQGTFKNLTAGFGVASEDADKMSQNLTQLSYDFASFFNTDVETDFDKLSSAMSGQVKGLREFGIDTTVASLQEYALARGIDASVRSMSQAEKSMLRYNYIMEKSIIMQNDMARTIITPANSLRILNAQLTQMKRALGNIVSVLVVQFIPYVQVMVEVLTDAFNAIAKLFGFSAKDFEADISGIDTTFGFDDAEESLDGVSGSIKKIKKQLMGFDELNIINTPDSDSGGSGGASDSGTGLNMPLEGYDFLKGFDKGKTEELKEKIKTVLSEITVIVSAAQLAIGAILTLTGANIPLGIGLMVSGVLGIATAVAVNWDSLTPELTNTLTTMTGAIAGFSLVLGSILAFSGAAIPLGIGLMVVGAASLATSVAVNWHSNDNHVESALNTIQGIVSGGFLALGALLALTGVNTPLGIALMAIGATTLASSKMIDWAAVESPVQRTLAKITLVVGTALLAVGAILALTGANLPLGLGLIAVGALSLGASVLSVKWDSLSTEMKDKINKITTIVSGSLLAVGAILALSGVSLPLGLGLMAVGALGLGTVATLNWDSIKGKVKTVVSSIMAILGAALPVVGALLILTGAGVGLGLSLIYAGFKLTHAAWEMDNNPITNFVKNMANGIIRIINKVIDAINDIFHISFKGLSIAGKEIIPSFDKQLIKVQRIATFQYGGFPDMGEIFIARERGPELVGSIGNKTAVANNDQIISGVESGVYRAMMAANSNKSGSQTIRIINEIDGDVVGEKVIQYHNGKVMQTGTSPLLV